MWISSYEKNRVLGPFDVIDVHRDEDGVLWASIESPPFLERWVSERMVTKFVEPFI